MEAFSFKNKKVLILSPQPWQSLFISKHNYAIALAEANKVYYCSAPELGMGLSSKEEQVENNLAVIHYKIPVPAFLYFKAKKFYKLANKKALKYLLGKYGAFDICIDFGCNALFNDIRWVNAKYKIYFPVDDFADLPIENRGANLLLSVSLNIIKKFESRGYTCHFINHGIVKEFELLAKENLGKVVVGNDAQKKVAYSGNLFIQFLNIPLFKSIIKDNPTVDFYFFGSYDETTTNPMFKDWIDFLKAQKNVQLKGLLKHHELAKALQEMDAFIMCYKADNINYHAENSHKILEFFATGKVVISTHIYLYDGSTLINMSPKGEDEKLVQVFKNTIDQLSVYNETNLVKQRADLALQNTYAKHIVEIETLINQSYATAV